MYNSCEEFIGMYRWWWVVIKCLRLEVFKVGDEKLIIRRGLKKRFKILGYGGSRWERMREEEEKTGFRYICSYNIENLMLGKYFTGNWNLDGGYGVNIWEMEYFFNF